MFDSPAYSKLAKSKHFSPLNHCKLRVFIMPNLPSLVSHTVPRRSWHYDNSMFSVLGSRVKSVAREWRAFQLNNNSLVVDAKHHPFPAINVNHFRAELFRRYQLPALYHFISFIALRWRHNERDSVSNHQPHDCLLNRSFGHRSK